MYVTSTPVFDRITAENEALRGEITHPVADMWGDWYDDLRCEVVELQMAVENNGPVDQLLLQVADHVSQAPRLR